MPGGNDRLHSGETRWKGGDDGRGRIVAMHNVGTRTPKRPVQTAHQTEKRTGAMENNVKTFRLKLFAEHANLIKAVHGWTVAAVALHAAHGGR